jgi:uncharacterized membrane protein (DUF373 family)
VTAHKPEEHFVAQHPQTALATGRATTEAKRQRWEKFAGGLQILQIAVVLALFVVGGVVLVRTMIDFLGKPSEYPGSIVSALDGILVVIIVVDILHTVVTHLRSATIPVRPFLVIGMLAGVRDILSASARLTLTGHDSPTSFTQSIVELGVGVGVVIVLLAGLLLLRAATKAGETDIEA